MAKPLKELVLDWQQFLPLDVHPRIQSVEDRLFLEAHNLSELNPSNGSIKWESENLDGDMESGLYPIRPRIIGFDLESDALYTATKSRIYHISNDGKKTNSITNLASSMNLLQSLNPTGILFFAMGNEVYMIGRDYSLMFDVDSSENPFREPFVKVIENARFDDKIQHLKREGQRLYTGARCFDFDRDSMPDNGSFLLNQFGKTVRYIGEKADSKYEFKPGTALEIEGENARYKLDISDMLVSTVNIQGDNLFITTNEGYSKYLIE